MTAKDILVSVAKKGRRRRSRRKDAGAASAQAVPVQPIPPVQPVPPVQPIAPALFGIGALGLALLVLGAYFPALSAGFVWDDRAFVGVAPIAEPGGIWRIWFSPSAIEGEGHYWPLTYTTFWLEHRLWGAFWAPGYHATNLVLHAANAVLVWQLLRRLGALPTWWAWAVAALFAVHPVHVEAVAWVIGRKDLLATLFYFCTALAWLRTLEEGATWRWHLVALALFAAGLLCKSIGMTLPIALLVLRWWQHGRLTAGDFWRSAPFFAVALGFGIGDMNYYEEYIHVDYTVLERVLIAAQSLWFYLWKLLWPADLMPVYPHWQVDVVAVLPWVCAFGALAVAGALWWLRGRIGRGALAGALFFAVTLGPTLGLVPFGYMQFSFVANRYQYLADIGALTVLVGAAWVAVGALGRNLQLAAAGVGAGLVIALATLAWQHAGIYRNEIVFYEAMLAGNPHARDAQFNLGSALFAAGQREEGLAATLASLEARPESMKAQYGAGTMLQAIDRTEEALAHFQRALAINANNSVVQYAAAQASVTLGRNAEAERHFRRALDVTPGHWNARIELAKLLANTNRPAAAAQLLREALTMRPGRTDVLLFLAGVEFSRQRYGEALDLYRTAKDRLPNSAVAWSGMGAALFHLGRPAEALRHVDQALALDPSLQDAINNRAAIAAAAAAEGEATQGG